MERVFVSHSKSDRHFVESELIPQLRRRGFQPWYCKKDIPVSSLWEREILKGLKACNSFLLIMSPRASQSEWVRDELNLALQIKSVSQIIPLLLERCDPADFHIRLPRIQFIDFTLDKALAWNTLFRRLFRSESAASAMPAMSAADIIPPKRRHSWLKISAIVLTLMLLLGAGIPIITSIVARSLIRKDNQGETSREPMTHQPVTVGAVPLNAIAPHAFGITNDVALRLSMFVDLPAMDSPLGDCLSYIQEKCVVPIVVDEEAFDVDLHEKDVRSKNVKGPRLSGITMRTSLKTMLKNIGTFEAQGSYIVVTTVPGLTVDVERSLENVPLRKLCDAIEDNFDVKVYSAALGPKENALVSLRSVSKVPLRTILERLARQVDADFSYDAGMLFCTPRNSMQQP